MCNIQFDVTKEMNYEITVSGNYDIKTSSVEIWASDIQPTMYPKPILFLNIHNTGLKYLASYQKEWYKTPVFGDYIWLQIRVKSDCGYSEYKIYCIRIGYGIQ